MNTTKLLALARTDLACFAIAAYPGFELAEHLKVVIERLEAVERGELKRLIICLPPRCGKSLLASTLFPAWYLGRHPDRHVIAACYGQELADDFGRRVRNLLADPMIEAIFPASRLSDDSTAAHRFGTTKGGAYFAVGRGSAITGRGAHLLLIDDPLKDNEEANSPTVRKGLKEWFSQVAVTRLMPGGAIVVIATRWHEDDLVGWLLREHSQQGWDVLSFPAIAEHDEPFRKEGEALWPERFPLDVLQSLRAQLGGAAFASLYQQRPAAIEGAIFKREWWRYYKTAAPMQPHQIVQSWDTALKAGPGNDFSACTTWGRARDGYYLLSAWKGRVEFPELKRKVAELAAAWNPSTILVEDSAAAQPLIQELQRGSRLPIRAEKIRGGKLSRAQAVTPMIEAGKVFLPEATTWLDDYLDELSTFPSAAHDDLTDSTTQALSFLRRMDCRDAYALYSAVLAKPRRLDPYKAADLVEVPEGWNPLAAIRRRL